MNPTHDVMPPPDGSSSGGTGADAPAAAPAGIVLLVDDMPQSLGALCTELESEGYTVLVAHDGQDALKRLDHVTPDAVLMDALMPGLSGFETCRQIKAQPGWAHIPVIFMTGLSETSHVVEGFAAGAVDYVVKPVRAQEVLARLAAHVRNARTVRLARAAADVGGLGVLLLDSQGRIAWQSPQAERWVGEFFPRPDSPSHGGIDQAELRAWLHADGSVSRAASNGRQLIARRLGDVALGEAMWLLSVQTAGDAQPSRLATAALTPREAEVLSWVAKGKTNRDVAQILGMSPRTVNKHLEHVFEKLGVETRAAAAALASRELG